MNEVAKEYAKAIFDLAVEQEKIKQYQEQMNFVDDQIKQNTEFNKILISPLDVNEKQEIIKNVFIKTVDKHILHFVYILINNDRLTYLSKICEEYEVLVKQHNEQVKCDVYTVLELTESEKTKLVDKLTKKFSKKIVLYNHIDKSLIGGMKIVVGNTVIDTSISNKLNKLKTMN